MFLAHNSADAALVGQLGEILRTYDLYPWIDQEQIPPGRWFQERIEAAMGRVRSAAIIIGKQGLGRWETAELRAFMSECVENELPVIPVLLPGSEIPQELRILRQLNWVRFVEKITEQEAIDNLRWGITGQRPRLLRPRPVAR